MLEKAQERLEKSPSFGVRHSLTPVRVLMEASKTSEEFERVGTSL
jgi:hypothetical protein